MECVETNLKYRNPIDQFPFYVLVETSGSNSRHDEEVSEGLSSLPFMASIIVCSIGSIRCTMVRDEPLLKLSPAQLQAIFIALSYLLLYQKPPP